MNIKFKDGTSYEIVRYTREFINSISDRKMLNITLDSDKVDTFDAICTKVTTDNISSVVITDDENEVVTFEDYLLESVIENTEHGNHNITIRAYKIVTSE